MTHPTSPSPATLAGAHPSLAALRPLFAPYCALEASRLEDALTCLLAGRLEGFRPVHGGRGHHFLLQWSGGLAPLDALQCELTFPQQPEVHYVFVVQAQDVLRWLAGLEPAAAGFDLPEDFWRWLILGDASGA